MYCGACARDVALIMGLRSLGHDVQVVPLYTPLRLDSDEPFPTAPIFMGGINVYLQQRFPLFRRIPGALDRILDSTSLLRLVSRFAISTKASELGEMTVDVLRGAEGPLEKESRRLFGYLEEQPKPDVAVITNTMLSGLAPQLKKELGSAVLCQVQGEDGFIGAMNEPYRSQAEELIRENAKSVELFVSPNESYAETMVQYLDIPEEKMRVVRTGLGAEVYTNPQPRRRDPFTVGYLSGIAHGKGLDILIEAWRRLVQEQGRDVRLLVAGLVLDKEYWQGIRGPLEEGELAENAEYVGELEPAKKAGFLRRCSAFCVPSRQAEVRAVAVMEALASGVPAVAPDTGVFPEMLALTGGGHLFASEDVDDLMAQLAALMDAPEEADRLGRQGAEGIAEHYSVERSAEGMAAALEEAAQT